MTFSNIAQNLAIKYADFTMQRSLYNGLNIDILQNNLPKIADTNKTYMLYAHVPFCHTFCPFCSFHKYDYDESAAKKYFYSLRLEMEQIKEAGFDFHSMYVGGGTTLINENELLKTLEHAKKLFNINEISCETDPNHIEPNNLKCFSGLIDRLSIGVQSFNDEILKKVARYSKFGSKDLLIEKLSKAVGILPITSIDLIFNFPFQTKDELLYDIQTATAIDSEQVTFYPLMKSNITKDKIAASLGYSSKDNEREFYEIICSKFKNYYQNNAWSFSKQSSNLKDEYVGTGNQYVGVGSGAFSFLNGELLINAFNLDEYSERVNAYRSAIIAKCKFKKRDKIRYLFLTQLFDGKINIDKFNHENEVNLKLDLYLELTLLKTTNAIKIIDKEIILTDFGRYLCVVLMKEFYIGMDKVRATFRDDAKIKYKKRLRIMDKL
ncbi:coproporphyrinogen III oxidase family protein [Campylobacter fetus]|uniref:coproporphyrinogen III oxidase family protein n=1 Tax=Campylobacter fetus TaxID=196 RepID=UPI000FCA0A55|nr:coproporphyrinogen III oxidase family protein [Campylobacter fetus]QQF52411.1 coproporphyrinogen III oxidase family protein [Campylobacter fetus subsp. venerealis]RUT48951.1 coproporphyrinogen III oxidase [Campylobacter fetus]RUT49152.1 coproporphyrinogen III oxidase [Campylobacter fetus]